MKIYINNEEEIEVIDYIEGLARAVKWTIEELKSNYNAKTIYDYYNLSDIISNLFTLTDEKLLNDWCEGDNSYFIIAILNRTYGNDSIKEIKRVLKDMIYESYDL